MTKSITAAFGLSSFYQNSTCPVTPNVSTFFEAWSTSYRWPCSWRTIPRPTHPMSCIGFYTMLRPVLGISNADIGTPWIGIKAGALVSTHFIGKQTGTLGDCFGWIKQSSNISYPSLNRMIYLSLLVDVQSTPSVSTHGGPVHSGVRRERSERFHGR